LKKFAKHSSARVLKVFTLYFMQSESDIGKGVIYTIPKQWAKACDPTEKLEKMGLIKDKDIVIKHLQQVTETPGQSHRSILPRLLGGR